MKIHLDDLQFQHESDSRPDLTFQAVHLEAITLEDNLCSGGVSYPLKRRLHLGGVDRGRRHEDVKRNWQKPERSHVELGCLPAG